MIAALSSPAITSMVWGALVSGSVIAATVGALVTMYVARRKSREEQLARVQVMLAEAFQAVAEYKEFPYAIRRRRHDAASEERVRLSEGLRHVQAKLTFYEEWTRIEDPTVGLAYRNLVQCLRQVAGVACNEAWSTPAITSDDQMNISSRQVDLTALNQFEREYSDAARVYVAAFLKARWRVSRPRH